MLTFNKKYFTLAVFLFIIEVLIALYVRDRIIRPYVGDYLVVMLVYCAVRTFWKGSVLKVAIGVLLFAYFIEVLQLLHFLTWLGLQDDALARVVLGSQFEWIDMLAYTLGILSVWWLEKIRSRQQPKVALRTQG